MTDNIVGTIQKIVQHELQKIRIGELGAVTSIFPHSDDGDKDNYECNVKLKNSGLELRKVPVATPHIGSAVIPTIGDLVFVSFVRGDVNQPIITGRLYNDEDRPPANKTNEFLIQAPYKGTTNFKMDAEGNINVVAGETTLTLKKDGDVLINSKAKLDIKIEGESKIQSKGNVSVESDGEIKIKVANDATIECTNCKIKASGNIDLGEGGGGVVTDMTHKCFLTGAPPVASTTVKAKG
ncbi:MAG: phage baseplate assembly protein V [Candidatus Desantisbacteria bacterium]